MSYVLLSVNSVYAKFSRSFKEKTVAVIKTIHNVTKNDIIICIMHMIVMVNEFRCYGLVCVKVV